MKTVCAQTHSDIHLACIMNYSSSLIGRVAGYFRVPVEILLVFLYIYRVHQIVKKTLLSRIASVEKAYLY